MDNLNSASDERREVPTRTLEESLAELQQIVERMESGEQSLETSLDDFERGINIVRECQRKLKDAEQRVRMLSAGTDEQTEQFPQTD